MVGADGASVSKMLAKMKPSTSFGNRGLFSFSLGGGGWI